MILTHEIFLSIDNDSFMIAIDIKLITTANLSYDIILHYYLLPEIWSFLNAF